MIFFLYLLLLRIPQDFAENLCFLSVYFLCVEILILTRMVVQGQLVEPAVCLSDLYDVFLLDIVKDTRQNL